MDFGAVLFALFLGMVVKLSVMIFAGLLVLRLYRATYRKPPSRLWLLLPEDNLPEIKILWWALVFFAISELTCGIEVYIITHSSPICGSSHSISSSIGMGLFVVGLYMLLDKKFLHYGQASCLANRVCAGCTADQPQGCKFSSCLLLLATFVALTAIPPLFAATDTMYADMKKYMLPFPALNHWYDTVIVPWLTANSPHYDPTGRAYHLPAAVLTLEWRILPLVAMTIAIASIGLLLRRKDTLGIQLLCFAFGVQCYVYLELVLYRVIGDLLMGSLGHEVVEFWFLCLTAEFLTRFYHAHDTSAAGQPVAVNQ